MVSQALSIQSGDLFNPAIGGLIALWGFHTDAPHPRVPDAAAIAIMVLALARVRILHLKR